MKILPTPDFDQLRALSVFSTVPDDELKKIIQHIECRFYPHEELIIREGSTGENFFILLSGKVRIQKKINDIHSEILGYYDEHGGLFGEMSLLEDMPRSAGIVADTDCETLAVSKLGFLELVNHVPKFTLEVAKSISKFLRQTDQRFIDSLKRENEELKNINRRLLEAQEELIGKERMALIGRMASTIIHDMKNPMSTIGGYAQLIKIKKNTQQQLEEYADIIAKQVIQFTSMTQELLSFAQGGEQMQIKPIQMENYMQECCDALALRFKEKEISFICDLKFAGEVHLDNRRFFRVFENIANNAIDVISKKDGYFKIESMEVETGVRIILEDNGPGMNDEVKSNVFKEFYTFGKRKGTGLGLAIVKRLVDEHNGIVKVESEEGKGTRFIIDLPAVGYLLLPKSKYQIPIPFGK